MLSAADRAFRMIFRGVTLDITVTASRMLVGCVLQRVAEFAYERAFAFRLFVLFLTVTAYRMIRIGVIGITAIRANSMIFRDMEFTLTFFAYKDCIVVNFGAVVRAVCPCRTFVTFRMILACMTTGTVFAYFCCFKGAVFGGVRI